MRRGGRPLPELLTVASVYVHNITSSEVSLFPSCSWKYLKLGGVRGGEALDREALLQAVRMADPGCAG